MKLLILVFLLGHTFPAYSKTYRIKEQGLKIVINLEDAWVYLEDALGLPHLFVSKTPAPKDSMMVINTKLNDLKLKPDQLKQDQKSYQEGRRNWAKSRNAKIIKFYAYENFKNENNSLHMIGLIYEIEKNTFIERSFFLECKNKFIQLKSTVLNIRPDNDQKLLKAVKDIRCL